MLQLSVSSISSELFVFLTFVYLHPGIALVFIGVFVEIVLEWKHLTERFPLIKKVAWLLLLVGLLLEFGEAARSDNEVLALRAQIAPRIFKGQMEAASRLSQFSGIRAMILSSPDTECTQVAGCIHFALDLAHWQVSVGPTEPNSWNGVRISLPLLVPGEEKQQSTQINEVVFKEATSMLVSELDKTGIIASEGVPHDANDFSGLIIYVGPKPSELETERMKTENQLFNPDKPL